MIGVAVAGTVLAVLLWVPSPESAARARLAAPRGSRRHRRPRALVQLILTAAAAGSGFAFGGPLGLAIGLVAAALTATGYGVLRSHRLRRLAVRRRAEVVRSCQALAGLLRTGHVPAGALSAAAAESPVLAEPAAVQRVGGDVGPVLRRLGRVPGQEGLVELANAWQVSERTGASMTATLDALAERLVADTALRNVVRTELSAPRATGRLLGALPLVGIVLGYSFGGDPVAYLTGSLAGHICLVVGVGLGCAGVVWTERLADSEAVR